MKKVVFLGVVAALSGCATVSYSPPEGSTNGVKWALTVSPAPPVVSLGPYTLSQVRVIDEHSALPFRDDGGSFTTQVGGDFEFRGSGRQATVTITKDSEVNVDPGGRFITTFATLLVRIQGGGEQMSISTVAESLGDPSFLEVGTSTKIVITKSFQGVSQGRPVSLWNLPTALVFRQGEAVLGYLSLVQDPVFYAAKGAPAKLPPEVGLAVLVAWECAKGNFETSHVNLLDRTY